MVRNPKETVIVVVEDDELQSEWIVDQLRLELPNFRVEPICTESEFVRKFATEFIRTPPDCFIVDVMLPWAYPEDTAPVPEDYENSGDFYRAGFRCVARIRRNQKTKDKPIIFHTVLEREEVEQEFPGIPYVPKDEDPKVLANSIVRLIAQKQQGRIGSHG